VFLDVIALAVNVM